jgi:alpha 1,2-mannosyltransferase
MASGPVEYVVVPKEHWSIPESLNRTKISQGMDKLRNDGVIYGGSTSYRHMCRFNSGFFYRQEALNKYDWYWRVEPDIELYCDINYDPFTFMRENNKVYGWVLSMYEFEATIPTLWQHTKDFFSKFPQYIARDNALGWLVDGLNVTKTYDEKKIEGNYSMIPRLSISSSPLT